MVAKLKAIKSELHRRMRDRLTEVGAWLRKIVLGYYQYHAVPGNTMQLRIFKLRVCRPMAECSGPPQPARTDAVGTSYPNLEPVDSPTRVLHAYPDARFYAIHPSQEPYA